MTAIAMQPDMTAIKQRQQATWASGDYHMIGTQILLVSEMLIEALDLHSTETRPRRRDRQRQRRHGRGPSRLHGRRASTTCPRCSIARGSRTEAEGLERRLHRGRRRGAAVRRRDASTSSPRSSARCSRPTRSRPRTSSPGSPGRAAGSASSRTRRSGFIGQLFKTNAQARRTAGRARLAGPVGHRGPAARAVRRRHRRDERREADVRLPLPVADATTSTTGAGSTARR